MTAKQKLNILKQYLFLLLLLAPASLFSQQILDDSYLQQMKQDVRILSSDSLEGREAGTIGEMLAALYIAERFEELDLKPWYDGCYFQSFTFTDGYEFPEDSNHVSITFDAKGGGVRHAITLTADRYTPLPWGADATVSGVVFDAGYCLKGVAVESTTKEKRRRANNRSTQAQAASPEPAGDQDTKGKLFLVRYDAPSFYDAEQGVYELMLSKARYAEARGAAGVLFYDPQGDVARVPANYFKWDEVQIPVVFFHEKETALSLPGATVTMQIMSAKRRSSSQNVAAWIDNGAEQSIVIGAHYDHLGWGIYNTRHKGLPEIHPGADDNASGVAGMIALAGWLKQSSLTNRNYIFAAFSAEEKGLIGSNRFVEDERVSDSTIFAMINFDMIGRVDEDDPVVSLLAAGSSPAWGEIIDLISEDVKAKPVNGGTSGSDHHYFYYNSIPVLFFFTGLHEDYHKPSDVVDKINFHGMRDVIEYSALMMSVLDTLQLLPFQEVEESSRTSRRAVQFSLGIIPDHATDVQGVKVQDVLKQRPAETAGIRKGDVIINISGSEIRNMYDYMRALNNVVIERGYRIDIIVLRNGEELDLFFEF